MGVFLCFKYMLVCVNIIYTDSSMLKLPLTLKAYQSISALSSNKASSIGKHIANTFKLEVSSIDQKWLPLQAALAHSSYVCDNSVKAVILNTTENNAEFRIKSAIFYKGIIAGCNCADDPSPQDTENEYCVPDSRKTHV